MGYDYKIKNNEANKKFLDELELVDDQTSENDTLKYKVEGDYYSIRVETGVDKTFDQAFVKKYADYWFTFKNPDGSPTYFIEETDELYALDPAHIYTDLRNNNLSGLADAFESARVYINSTEPTEAPTAKRADDEEASTIPPELQNVPEDNAILKFYLENNEKTKSFVERANSILEETKSLEEGNVRQRKIEDAVSRLNGLRNSLIIYRDWLGENTDFITWYSGEEQLDNEDKTFLKSEYIRITGELGSKILELEARMAELSEKAGTPAPIADRVTLLVQPGQPLYGIEEENEVFNDFATSVRTQAALLDTSQAHLDDSDALVGEKGHKAAKAEAVRTLQTDKDKIDDYRSRFILPGPDRTDSTWGELTSDHQTVIEEEYSSMAAALADQSEALEERIEKLNTSDTTEASADLDAQPTRAELRQEKARKKAEEKAKASRAAVADAGEESGLEDMGLPEVLEQYSSHTFVTPLPGVLQRVDLLVADTDKLIKRIRTEEDADEFVFDDSVARSDIETERADKSAIVDARLKAVDEQWKTLETQRRYLDNTKQSLENLDAIDWRSMASKTDAQAAVIGFYEDQISKITKKQDELKDDLEPDLKVIRRQIDDDADYANTTSRSSTSGARGTSVSATVTTPTGFGGAATTTKVQLKADPSPVTAGDKVTVRFSTNADPDTLSLTAGIVGKPTQPLEIKLESDNNYIAQFNVPNDTKEGEIKFSLTSEDLKTVGSLSIDVRAATATTSAPVPGSNISKLKVEAKPSKVKPGDTVTLDITAWGVDGKKAEGLKRFLKATAITSNDTRYHPTISEKGNGKYEATFKVPDGAPSGEIKFEVSSTVKTDVKATTKAEVKTSSTKVSEPKEKPEETPGSIELVAEPATAQPGKTVKLTATVKNKNNTSENMEDVSLSWGITGTMLGGPTGEINNNNGTYSASYTIPNDKPDGSTITFTVGISGSTGASAVTDTATVTISLPAPTTAPDQFLGLNDQIDWTAPKDAKLPPLPKGLNATIRASWENKKDYSTRYPDLAPFGAEANLLNRTATLTTVKVVDAIWNSTEIGTDVKKAYLKQLKTELDELSKYVDAQITTLNGKTAPVGDMHPEEYTIAKAQILLVLEEVKNNISNAKMHALHPDQPVSTATLSKLLPRGIDKKDVSEPIVARYVELASRFHYKDNTITRTNLRTQLIQLTADLQATNPASVTRASTNGYDVLRILRTSSQTLVDSINAELQPVGKPPAEAQKKL